MEVIDMECCDCHKNLDSENAKLADMEIYKDKVYCRLCFLLEQNYDLVSERMDMLEEAV
jgi:hypothetical protein